jgi:hypothetical protein
MGANAVTTTYDFTAGQVLTAAQMDNVNCGVPVFATTTTRDGAFGTGKKALAEGQMAFIEAGDILQYYTGSAWTNIYPLPSWTTWTPTWTGASVGNGTVTARYVQFNTTVIAKIYFALGSTSSITGPVDATLPVAPANYNGVPMLGWASYQDSGATIYSGAPAWIGGSTVRFVRWINSSNNIVNAELSNIAPFTWGSGDHIVATFIYEA